MSNCVKLGAAWPASPEWRSWLAQLVICISRLECAHAGRVLSFRRKSSTNKNIVRRHSITTTWVLALIIEGFGFTVDHPRQKRHARSPPAIILLLYCMYLQVLDHGHPPLLSTILVQRQQQDQDEAATQQNQDFLVRSKLIRAAVVAISDPTQQFSIPVGDRTGHWPLFLMPHILAEESTFYR